MIKRIISVILAVSICALGFSACTDSSDSLEGAHVFMFKCTGNAYGNMMYKGFKRVIEESGGKASYNSPAEATVTSQVKMLDTLIAQKVASITISTCGDMGYKEVFKKAKKAGITIISADSAASPEYRATHVDPCYNEAIGASLVWAGTLIALGKDYPEDGNMQKAVEIALGEYKGKEIKFGAIGATIDTPIQNIWMDEMENELKKDMYKGKVNSTLDRKYGNDDPIESTTQANAFIAENKVDMIISPTTIGMAAAGQAIKLSDSKIKLTGLGLPSEMQSFMPLKPEDNAFDFICPYMLLWDVCEFGAAAAATVLAINEGRCDGSVGSSFEYKGKTYEVVENTDGGTRVISLAPYFFHKGNMAEWKDKL